VLSILTSNIDRSRFTGVFFDLLYRRISSSLFQLCFTIWSYYLQFIVLLILEEMGVDAFEYYDDSDGCFCSASTLFHYYNIEREIMQAQYQSNK
jgi:hypothetical protein